MSASDWTVVTLPVPGLVLGFSHAFGLRDRLAWILLPWLSVATHAAELPPGREFTNSVGMRFVKVEPARFQMGQLDTPLPFDMMPVTGGRGDRMDSLRDGDWDERPVHEVAITRPYLIAVTEVSNRQYELFDAHHRRLRGKREISTADSEAVVYVNWYDANAFCRWLSDKEDLPYRLPTEAEWEYACRAGTSTHYSAGDALPAGFQKIPSELKSPEPVSLHTARTPANRWGLFDMHGNVEEWCLDWYGPYPETAQTDPVGYANGEFRVTRGGSHSAPVFFLRSANRSAALPETRNWITGFRVVLGQLPNGDPLPPQTLPRHQQEVIQRDPSTVTKGPDPSLPYFAGPRKFVKIPNGSNGPLFAAHNHDPAIAACPNGDLLAIWYTCDSERNRELGQAASRLRWGQQVWDPASPFFDVPDRNDHAPALGVGPGTGGRKTIYHLTGVSFAGEHSDMALAMRTSEDSGASWSKARLVLPDFNRDHMPSESVFWLRDGTLAFAQDGPRSLWMSRDAGRTWFNPGGGIAGIHPGVVELRDGSLLGFGRGDELDGMMPESRSTDRGKTFTSTASSFPRIDGGQRLVLMRLQEGPLLFASFADDGIAITDATGQQRQVRGLFTAVSTDEGKTWPQIRLVSDEGAGHPVETTGGRLFVMSGSNGEPRGYLAGCQAPNGVIHLISSRQHYAFNLQWLMTPPPPLQPPVQVQSVVESFDGPNGFDAPNWVIRKSFTGGFDDKGGYAIRASGRSCGINRMVGTGSFDARVSVRDLQFDPGDRRGRTTPAFVVEFHDSQGLGFKIRIEPSQISLGPDKPGMVTYDTPPASAKLRVTYNETTNQYSIHYGLNGEEPAHELPESKVGLSLPEPFTEDTVVGLVEEHGGVVLEHFELKAL